MPSTIQLEGLQTEERNPVSGNIDQVSTLELCQIINNEDATVALAVQKCLPIIAQAIDGLAGPVRKGGRVVYVGAGTSGRYCDLDYMRKDWTLTEIKVGRSRRVRNSSNIFCIKQTICVIDCRRRRCSTLCPGRR